MTTEVAVIIGYLLGGILGLLVVCAFIHFWLPGQLKRQDAALGKTWSER